MSTETNLEKVIDGRFGTLSTDELKESYSDLAYVLHFLGNEIESRA